MKSGTTTLAVFSALLSGVQGFAIQLPLPSTSFYKITFIEHSKTIYHAFTSCHRRRLFAGYRKSKSRRYLSDFDFPSAMPEKPQLSLEQKMEQSADDFLESMTGALGDGVEAPPELEELRQLRQNKADSSTLALKIYELMIERGMRYDEAPETGTLTPTEFNIPENLQVKEVQNEFGHLYRYGMILMDKGLLTVDQVKETVKERLIKRTGLTPEEFDTWLGF